MRVAVKRVAEAIRPDRNLAAANALPVIGALRSQLGGREYDDVAPHPGQPEPRRRLILGNVTEQETPALGDDLPRAGFSREEGPSDGRDRLSKRWPY
jgi:hypothetical protein